MLKEFLKPAKQEKGQALVELAFVLPILLILVFGIIEFGNIYYTNLTLNNASREGARTGAIRATQHDVNLEGEIRQIIKTRVPSLDYNEVQVYITPNSGDIARGDDLKVELRYNRRLLTPLFEPILDTSSNPGYIQLKSETTMRVE